MINLDELIKLADRATQGEWIADIQAGKIKYEKDGIIAQHIHSYGDTEFIAAANPQTVKKLCEVIKVYETELKRCSQIASREYAELALAVGQKILGEQ